MIRYLFQWLWHPTGVSSSCSLPVDPGPCQGHFLRWHYDAHAQRCLPFKYGGCHGNANRFRTLQECHVTCLRGETTIENDGATIDTITTHRMKNQGMTILCESAFSLDYHPSAFPCRVLSLIHPSLIRLPFSSLPMFLSPHSRPYLLSFLFFLLLSPFLPSLPSLNYYGVCLTQLVENSDNYYSFKN